MSAFEKDQTPAETPADDSAESKRIPTPVQESFSSPNS